MKCTHCSTLLNNDNCTLYSLIDTKPEVAICNACKSKLTDTPVKPRAKRGTVVKYGGIDLPIVNSSDPLVPKTADKIKLEYSDEKKIAIAILTNKPVLLIGETGTGKTSVVKYIAHITKSPYVRVNLTGYSTPDELIGSKSVKNGATYYENGIVTDAMKRGAILVLDEINATTPDCMFILHGLLDSDRQITLPNGEVIRPAEGFRVFATCNPDYEGTKSLNKALVDRFSIIIGVDTLEAKHEIKLLQTRTQIDEPTANTLVAIATELRKTYIEQKLSFYTSTRSLLNIAELIRDGLPIKDAYITGLINKTQSKDERQAMLDVFCATLKIASDSNNADYPVVIAKKQLDELNEKIENTRNISQELLDTKDELRTTNETKNNQDETINEKQKEIEVLKERIKSLEFVEILIKNAAK